MEWNPTMKKLLITPLAMLLALPLFAQEPVLGVANPEALFQDDDPQLHANKRVAYHIMRDLLQCNHWDRADEWITERYIQHNPNAPSGRAAVVNLFSVILADQRPRAATCNELTLPIVAVLAQDDLVTVVWPMTCRHEGMEPYTSTWFDMWRIVDGKADQHWDPAMRIPTGCTPGAAPP
jgi:predicted SnoaL-like aldol condensation-catalyzing enzyme